VFAALARGSAALILLLATACVGDEASPDASAADSGFRADAAPPADAGFPDAAAPDAAGAPDAMADAGLSDAGTSTLTGVFDRISCADVTGTCFQYTPDQLGQLLDRANDLDDDTTLILSGGTFRLDNALTIRRNNGITLVGQGIDRTILDFSLQVAQSNGVDVIGDRFVIRELTITDSKKDGLRIEDSTDVVIRRIKVTWSGGPLATNGAYAIYPVRCTNVLLEDSQAYNASDAGLYVGQSINVIVRRNVARRNVAGLEIENTQYAEVYENLVEDNTAGLMVFDLPGNPVIGRDISVHDNVIRGNNRPNFAPSGTTVSQIPAGTGTFMLASRRVEYARNTYQDNNTLDIAILSGLAIQSSTGAWALDLAMVRGSTAGLDLPSDGVTILNFRTSEIWVHDNTHANFGTRADVADPDARPLGALLGTMYGLEFMSVDAIIYDAIGEQVMPGAGGNSTNLNHVCLERESGATFAALGLDRLFELITGGMFPSLDDIYRPAQPFAPFDCSGFTGAPIAPVVLPFGG
jgi:parallel beta-helix repeat protein